MHFVLQNAINAKLIKRDAFYCISIDSTLLAIFAKENKVKDAYASIVQTKNLSSRTTQ